MKTKPTYHHIFFLIVTAIIMGNSGCYNTGELIFDVHGHRGCRGLMPENTLPAFEEALRLGATTLEMDVVISGDQQVLASHEAWFSNKFCTDSMGNSISPAQEKQFNIYQMSLEDIRKFDCGAKGHPDFSMQEKLPAHKPLLSEVISLGENYPRDFGVEDGPYYNIELKREAGGDGVFQPEVEKFVDLVMEVVEQKEVQSRVIIQAFDIITLQTVRNKYPDVKLSLLVDVSENYQSRIADLGFYPEYISPDFSLVDKQMMEFSADKNIDVIPWTVNEKEDMHRLIDMRVSGIITDYPDRLVEIVRSR